MADLFVPGAPAKLHAPGRPWHKTRVRLLAQDGPFFWKVSVRRWSRKALAMNPAVGAEHSVRAPIDAIRLLPGSPW